MDFSNQVGVGYILDKATYEKMTSQKLELAADQVAIYSKGVQYQAGQTSPLMKRRWKLPKSCPRM